MTGASAFIRFSMSGDLTFEISDLSLVTVYFKPALPVASAQPDTLAYLVQLPLLGLQIAKGALACWLPRSQTD